MTPLALDRLKQLAQRGDAASLVLMAAASADATPLELLPDSLARLQRARILLDGGQPGVAGKELDGLPATLPRGLVSFREDFVEEMAGLSVDESATQHRESTGDSMHPSPGRKAGLTTPRTPDVVLGAWLTRVQSWREVRGV